LAQLFWKTGLEAKLDGWVCANRRMLASRNGQIITKLFNFVMGGFLVQDLFRGFMLHYSGSKIGCAK
jgi:hypothetical protein